MIGMSRGAQRLLSVLADNQRAHIARKIQCTPQTIGLWSNGVSKPETYAFRYALWKHFRICMNSWDQPVGDKTPCGMCCKVENQDSLARAS